MTLEKVIKRYEDLEIQFREKYRLCTNEECDGLEFDDPECRDDLCLKCAAEHHQLAEWLKELKRFHEGMENVKAPEQEPCEDTISRQAAIDAFERFIHELGIEDEPYNYGEIALSIENIPPVTPQSKMGQWIQVESDKCKCNQCEVIQFIAMYPYGRKNYCPNCGAKMREVEE